MHLKQTIRQNIKWLVVVNIISKPLWFVFLLVSTRVLGPVEFGKYMLAVSYMSVAIGLLEGGIDIHTIRALAANQGRYSFFFSHTIWLKIVSGFIAGIGAYGLSLIFPSLVPDLILFIAAAIYATANVTLTHFRYIFRAFEVMKYEAWSIAIEKITIAVFCGAALVIVPSALGYGISFSAAYVLTACITLWLVFKKIGMPDIPRKFGTVFSEIIKPALPFATMNLFIIIYLRSGTLLLAILTHNDQLVGYFNAGYRLVEAFVLIPSMIIAPLYPVFARRIVEKEEISRFAMDAIRIILSIAVVISVPIFILHDQVTLLLFGSQYADAALSVGILCLAMIPVGITWVVGSIVALSGRQMKANFYFLGTTLGNITLLVLLIPALGVKGAALSVLATECAVAFFNWMLVRDYIGLRSLITLLIKAAVPSILVYGISFGFLNLPIVVILPVVVGCVAGGLYLTRLISIEDVTKAFRERAA